MFSATTQGRGVGRLDDEYFLPDKAKRGRRLEADDARNKIQWSALRCHRGARTMNSVIYLIGLVVVVLAVLSFLGLH